MGRTIYVFDRRGEVAFWYRSDGGLGLDDRLAEWFTPRERPQAKAELLEGSPFTRSFGAHRDGDLEASGIPLIGGRRDRGRGETFTFTLVPK